MRPDRGAGGRVGKEGPDGALATATAAVGRAHTGDHATWAGSVLMPVADALDRYALERRGRDNPILRAKLTGRPPFSGRWRVPAGVRLDTLDGRLLRELVAARLAEGERPEAVKGELLYLKGIIEQARLRWNAKVRPGIRFPVVKKPLAGPRGAPPPQPSDRTPAAARPGAAVVSKPERVVPLTLTPEVTRRVVAELGSGYFDREGECLRDGRDLFALMVCTGAKGADLLRLRWKDVAAPGFERLTLEPDEGRDGQVVDLPEPAREVLGRRLALRRRGSPWVFENPSGPSRPRDGRLAFPITQALIRAGVDAAPSWWRDRPLRIEGGWDGLAAARAAVAGMDPPPRPSRPVALVKPAGRKPPRVPKRSPARPSRRTGRPHSG